jgi:hypothetical protein
MIAKAGLQCGHGEELGGVLLELAAFPFPIIRIDLQQCDQETTALRAQEVINAGLQPLCIIRRSEQMIILPEGSLIELGNEPDLEHFNFPLDEYLQVAAECVPIAYEHDLRLYLGAVSNLNRRGFAFLRAIPWKSYSTQICCSIHRYPEGNNPDTPHWGFRSREDEVRMLRNIVGFKRPLACTEVGYHDGPGGSTEETVATNMMWERKFFSDEGFEICSAYNINDGTGTEPIDHYGFRRLDGSWKPVAYAFTQGVE